MKAAHWYPAPSSLPSDLSKPVTTKTDGLGVFRVDHLPVGRYVIQIGSPGFRTYRHEVILNHVLEYKFKANIQVAPLMGDVVMVQPASQRLRDFFHHLFGQ